MTARQSRADWSLHTTAGRCAMLDGEFSFDRGWSPQGQGSYSMPLAEYEALHPELAPNPSFDVNTNGWTALRAVTRVTGDAIAGAFGRVVGQAGDAALLVYATLPVRGGATLDLVLDRYRTNLASKWVELSIEWRTAGYAVLGRVSAPRVPIYTYWQDQLRLSSLAAPLDAAVAIVELRIHNTQGGGGYLPATGNRIDVDGLHFTEQVLRPRQRKPVLLVGEVWTAYSDGLGTLALEGAGTTLNNTTWPLPEHGPHWLPYGAGNVIDARPRAVAWNVYPREVRIDEGQQTAIVELATVEALLQDAPNLSGADIEPPRSVFGGYYVGRILSRLAEQVGVQISVPAADDFTTPAVEAWRQGQALWDWFTRVRNAAGLGYLLDAETNTMRLYGLAGAWPYGSVAEIALERTSRVGAVAAQGLDFADALTVVWRWTAGGVENVTRENVVASHLTSWQAATRSTELDRPGPPIAGVAQRMVDNLARLRKVTNVTTPTTPSTLVATPLSLDGGNWQAVRYGFASELATITILQEA